MSKVSHSSSLSNRSDGLPPPPRTATDNSQLEMLRKRMQALPALVSEGKLSTLHAEHVQSFLQQFCDLSQDIPTNTQIEDLEKSATIAFSDLILDGAFDLLKEVFSTFNNAMDGWKSEPGATYETSLTIRVPLDWQFAPDILTEVFSQIHAQKVTVERLPDPSGPLPESLNTCLSALLKAGTTKLHLASPPTSPQGMESWAGTQLTSITLGSTPKESWRGDTPLSPEAIKSFSDVMGNLSLCATLKHLTLEHPDLLCLHDAFEKFTKNTEPGAVLTSVSFRAPMRWDPTPLGDSLHMLIEKVGQMPSLQKIEATIPWATPGNLEELFVRKLKGHGALKELVFVGGIADPAESMSILPQITALGQECPTLETIRLQFSARFFNIQDIDGLRQRGLDIDPQDVADTTEKLFSNKKPIALKTVVINGVFLPAKALGQWVKEMHPQGALAKLENLDLQHCNSELGAAVALAEALWALPTFKDLWMPYKYNYYVTGPNNELLGCKSDGGKPLAMSNFGEAGSTQHFEFTLQGSSRTSRVWQKTGRSTGVAAHRLQTSRPPAQPQLPLPRPRPTPRRQQQQRQQQRQPPAAPPRQRRPCHPSSPPPNRTERGSDCRGAINGEAWLKEAYAIDVAAPPALKG